MALLSLFILSGCNPETKEINTEPRDLVFLVHSNATENQREDYLDVTYLTDELKIVDKSDNLMQRLEWRNKTYIIFRYLGDCKSNDYIDLRTNNC